MAAARGLPGAAVPLGRVPALVLLIARVGLSTRLVGLFATLGVALSCAPLAGRPEGDAQRACWPSFPYQDGWLGGDAAYSVPLRDGRSVWLFGDTFVGRPGAVDRVGASFIHNSIGVSHCDAGGRFEIRYAWGRAGDGAPRAFLERDEAAGWWWLYGGFLHGDRLYLGLLEVERATPHGPLNVPFRVTGTALAEIRHLERDPAQWQVQVLPLSRDREAFPVAALVPLGPHLYLFGFLDRDDGRYPRVLARLPLARLGDDLPDLPSALETLGADGRWLAGLRPAEARIVMEDSATEMSVHFHASIGKWLALYNYPNLSGTFPAARPSDAVHARLADALEGPWSEPRLVFRIPELAEGRTPPADPNLACYAAKEQPQFSRPGSATFTYVCNLFTGAGEDPFDVLRRLQVAMELYRPVSATVTLPTQP